MIMNTGKVGEESMRCKHRETGGEFVIFSAGFPTDFVGNIRKAKNGDHMTVGC